ncbi:hypothetical protein F4819DRAFT_490027 [Hypoxylon fuscum]|nr:hypothetical protein F4819DRAFT_490027 [Hypoxylon fuscum]
MSQRVHIRIFSLQHDFWRPRTHEELYNWLPGMDFRGMNLREHLELVFFDAALLSGIPWQRARRVDVVKGLNRLFEAGIRMYEGINSGPLDPSDSLAFFKDLCENIQPQWLHHDGPMQLYRLMGYYMDAFAKHHHTAQIQNTGIRTFIDSDLKALDCNVSLFLRLTTGIETNPRVVRVRFIPF